MKTDNVVVSKSKLFAVRIIELYRHLMKEHYERDVFRQLLKSGTSIGANVKEAVRGQTKADFGAKMNIALKEASETEYWIELLHETDLINDVEFNSLIEDNRELIKLLTAIVKTSLGN